MERIKYVDFIQEFARITTVYGDKWYPPDRIAAIWTEVRDIAPEAFRRIVTDLIADRPSPPMRDAFRAALGPLRFNADGSSTILSQLAACRWCDRKGLLIAKLNRGAMVGRTGPYAFRCPFCEAAEKRRVSLKIPRWSRAYVPEYWPTYGDGSIVDPDEAFAPTGDDIQPSELETPDLLAPVIAMPERARATVLDAARGMAMPALPAYTEQSEFDI